MQRLTHRDLVNQPGPKDGSLVEEAICLDSRVVQILVLIDAIVPIRDLHRDSSSISVWQMTQFSRVKEVRMRTA